MNDEQKFGRDLKAIEVCQLLRVRRSWLSKHLNQFNYYRIPGRGRGGGELRFHQESVQNFRNRKENGKCPDRKNMESADLI